MSQIAMLQLRESWSPSTRRAWIEIEHQGSVDFNKLVALHPEGVDRNHCRQYVKYLRPLSPSTRRAWIEMQAFCRSFKRLYVALHPEGVDRNPLRQNNHGVKPAVALHPEGVDRNYNTIPRSARANLSPSTRRAWIEMIVMPLIRSAIYSVALHPEGVDRNSRSGTPCRRESLVALHPEGVDRNVI